MLIFSFFCDSYVFLLIMAGVSVGEISSDADLKRKREASRLRKRKGRRANKSFMTPDEIKEHNKLEAMRKAKYRAQSKPRKSARVSRVSTARKSAKEIRRRNKTALNSKRMLDTTRSEAEKRELLDDQKKRRKKIRYNKRLEQTPQQRKSARLSENKRKRAEYDNYDREKKDRISATAMIRRLGERNGSTINKKLEAEKSHQDDFMPFIKFAVSQAMKKQHRTKDQDDPERHRAHVCICCDCFIPANEPIRGMKRKDIILHKKRLSVFEYEQYHGVKLPPELVKQYHVAHFNNMLLSPRARRCKDGWVTCLSCRQSLRPEKKFRGPPKYSIANGFAIGEFPRSIRRLKPTWDGDWSDREVDLDELSDEMRALLAVVRPYGHIFAYTGGAHKSITGTMAYFEQDQPKIGGVMQNMRDMGAPHNMYIMLCGRTTPAQRSIIRQRAELDTDEYLDILNYFITESNHPGYKDLELPEHFPIPEFIEDEVIESNTDHPIRPDIENAFKGGTYYFSSAQEPSKETSVFEDSSKFARAILTQSSPTLLAIGGQYANMKELDVENVLPFAFPFGLGGPGGRRRTPISSEACFQRYFRLSMKQFMRGDVILILGHMYNRILSYRSGVIACRSRVNGVPIGKTLAKFKPSDFETNINGDVSEATETLLNVVETTCKALGHTPEAAKQARKCFYAFNDHFGLNSLFLTVTPEDLDSFVVRLNIDPTKWVSEKFYKS